MCLAAGICNVAKEEQEISIGGKKKKNKVIFLTCIIIILALCAVIFYLVYAKKSENKEKRRNVVVNESNIDDAVKGLQEGTAPAGSYVVTMNNDWVFQNSDTPSKNAYVENALENTNSVYFDIIRSDTEETIYESPIIPVGSHLEEITLDKKLSAGKYDCVIVYHLLDENDKSAGTLRLTLNLTIEQ